jgi:hypothetical protein
MRETVAGYFQYGQLLSRMGRLDEARKMLSDGIVVAQRAGDMHARDEMQAADRKNGVEEADMYQIFAYATKFESEDNVLLYPAVAGVTPKEYDASDPGTIRKIRVETINLNYDLARTTR